MKNFTIQKRLACDTVVVGGGTTGLAAVVAAARGGADTLLVEANGYPGGNACSVPCWMGFHARSGEAVIGGFPLEFAGKLREAGAASEIYMDPICGSAAYVNPHWLKIVAARELEQAGVRMLFHTRFVELELAEGRIVAVYLAGGEGLIRVACRNVIDCTDNGAVAIAAGETMRRGREGDGKTQVSSWVFEVGNIDFAKLGDYFTRHPEDLRPFPLADAAGHVRRALKQDGFVSGAFGRLVARAERDGMSLPRNNMPGVFFPRSRTFMTVAGRVEAVDPGDSGNHTRSELEGMAQVPIWMEFLRRYAPGFEEAVLTGSCGSIGVREINHLMGAYTLTAEDLLTGRDFADTIALGAYHLDIHSPDHKGLETRFPKVYHIPYRALLPLRTENLLVAGRAISATHEALASTRVIPISMAEGEAAGTAAALAVKTGKGFQELEVVELQAVLRKNRVLLEPGAGVENELWRREA